MLIVGDRIVDDNLLKNADKDHIGGASYYLTIGYIIPAGQDAQKYDPNNPLRHHTMKPGGLACVVSKQIFNIKDTGITALVTLRSAFTKRGLLALDVGLVDANYEGPIGSIIINFSKSDVHLKEDEKFFRVIFFEHEKAPGVSYPKQDHKKYITQRLSDVIEKFPSTFLQTDEMEERIKETLSDNEVIEELESKLLEQLGTHLIKKYWWQVLGLLMAWAGLVKYLLPELNLLD